MGGWRPVLLAFAHRCDSQQRSGVLRSKMLSVGAGCRFAPGWWVPGWAQGTSVTTVLLVRRCQELTRCFPPRLQLPYRCLMAAALEQRRLRRSQGTFVVRVSPQTGKMLFVEQIFTAPPENGMGASRPRTGNRWAAAPLVSSPATVLVAVTCLCQARAPGLWLPLVSVVPAAAQCGSCEGCSSVLRMPAVPRQEKPLCRLPAQEGVAREQESNPLLNNSVRATCSEPVKLVLLGLVFLSLPIFLLSQSSLPLSFLSSFTQNTANKRLPLWCLRVSS